ncbi:MAG: dTMP kinase [Nitrospirae bacterium]|nr:dTMP kinase [Nitrospirota bacterium]
MKKKGLFITFEGIEGCGKTTQMNLLSDYLKKEGVSVLKTREPGGTKIGEKIRDILLNPDNKKMAKETEILLYGASRMHHVKELIEPAIKAGKIVLCDRYADSTLAYQGFGRNMGVSFIKKVCPLSLGTIQPDLTILLDLDVKAGLDRIRNRKGGRDRIEKEKIAFHNRVRKGYLRLAMASKGRIKVVRADKEIDEIQKEIKSIVTKRLLKKRY